MLLAISFEYAVAPTLSGVIFSWSIASKHMFPFNYFAVFLVVAAMLVASAKIAEKV
jgi:hypothetical protein